MADQLLSTAPVARGRPRPGRLDAWRRDLLDTRPIDVSVCIANWNCRELLRACLTSLLDWPQGVRLEVIVVDNASADGAADMVAEEFPEVVLVRNATNRGFARANNQAARKAHGRYLFFLNNDTVAPPEALRQLLDFADKHPEVGMIGPRLRDARGQYQVSYRLRPTLATLLHRVGLVRWTGLLKRAYRRYRRQEFDPERVRPVDVLMGAAMWLRREVFLACGGWDDSFTFGGEDIDLSLRVNRRAEVVYYPDVDVIHFGRVSTRQHIGFASTNMAVGFARYLRKCGYSEAALLLYKALVTLDAPVQLLGKGLEYLCRRLRGRREKAEKSYLAFRAALHFVTRGLAAFWRA
jgi:GT2 family glycosyltransferase